MKVLVTGGAGFLGSRIVQRLAERGAQVTVCSRQATKHEAPGTKHAVVDIDIRDADAVSRAVAGHDIVFHVAAKAGVWGPRAEFFGINVTGTRNVLRACHEHGVRKLIYTSTPSVVFSRELHGGADESLPYATRHLSHYSHSKSVAEQEVLAASGVGGLQTCALRPHLVLGADDPHLLPRVLAKAGAGKLKQVGDGTNRVDVTHVDDAAQAHLDALDHLDAAAGKAYFVRTETVDLWPWINALLKRAGLAEVRGRVGVRTAYYAGAALELIWRALRLRSEPPMTRFVACNLAWPHWFDISAAQRDLGYQPRKTAAMALDEYFRTHPVRDGSEEVAGSESAHKVLAG